MSSAFSWHNSISLCPASFHIPRPNLPVTPGVCWLPTFAFQSPIMKRTSFLGVILKRLVGLHRTIQLQLLQCYWLGHRLGLPLYWMVCLGNEQRSFCHFWDCTQECTAFWAGGSEVKASAWNVRDPGSIPELGKCPGEGNDTPLQYSCLGNSMNRGSWRTTVHAVTKSWTRLSD